MLEWLKEIRKEVEDGRFTFFELWEPEFKKQFEAGENLERLFSDLSEDELEELKKIFRISDYCREYQEQLVPVFVSLLKKTGNDLPYKNMAKFVLFKPDGVSLGNRHGSFSDILTCEETSELNMNLQQIVDSGKTEELEWTSGIEGDENFVKMFLNEIGVFPEYYVPEGIF